MIECWVKCGNTRDTIECVALDNGIGYKCPCKMGEVLKFTKLREMRLHCNTQQHKQYFKEHGYSEEEEGQTLLARWLDAGMDGSDLVSSKPNGLAACKCDPESFFDCSSKGRIRQHLCSSKHDAYRRTPQKRERERATDAFMHEVALEALRDPVCHGHMVDAIVKRIKGNISIDDDDDDEQYVPSREEVVHAAYTIIAQSSKKK